LTGNKPSTRMLYSQEGNVKLKNLGALNLKCVLHACRRLADSDGFIHASHQHIRNHAWRPHLGDVVLPAQQESLPPGTIELHDTPQRKLIVANECLVNADDVT
jgi:hypothetical protein